MGSIEMNSMFGNKITVYYLERTICDCVRSRNRMEISILTDALKHYARRKDKNLHSLMNMAEKFKISDLLRSYMQMLL